MMKNQDSVAWIHIPIPLVELVTFNECVPSYASMELDTRCLLQNSICVVLSFLKQVLLKCLSLGDSDFFVPAQWKPSLQFVLFIRIVKISIKTKYHFGILQNYMDWSSVRTVLSNDIVNTIIYYYYSNRIL
jgi:hypothetical protein